MKTFTAAQANELRTAFSKIDAIDPDGSPYAAVCKLLDSLSQRDLNMLVRMDIKFVSKLARNRVVCKSVSEICAGFGNK